MTLLAKSCIALLVLIACGVSPRCLCGQNRQELAEPFPLSSAERLVERMFGQEAEAEREAIEKIKISPREESRAGRTAWETFRAQLRQRGVSIERKGDDVQYVERLVRQLRPLMQNAGRYRRIEVFVADTEDTDARSFPGGWIVVSRGLIEFCGSEAALVGVLGHELSHIDRGHQLFQLRRWKLAQQSLAGPPDPERMLTASGIMAKTFMQPFRPEEETQADRDGAKWAFQLGYDPSELARVFASLQRRDRNRPNVMPTFLRSHPVHADRFQTIAELAASLKKRRPAGKLYIGRENLERRIPRSIKELSDR